jgi:hypothetical protein
MPDLMRGPRLHVCLRRILGAIFVGAGALKLWDVAAFADQVGEFGIVFDELVPITAWSLVLLEILIGAGLLAAIPGSLALAVALLLLFMGVLAYGIMLGLDIECGCFGPVPVKLTWQWWIDAALLGWCGLTWRTRPGDRASPDMVS